MSESKKICEGCGAPLNYKAGAYDVTCEYCDRITVLREKEDDPKEAEDSIDLSEYKNHLFFDPNRKGTYIFVAAIVIAVVLLVIYMFNGVKRDEEELKKRIAPYETELDYYRGTVSKVKVPEGATILKKCEKCDYVYGYRPDGEKDLREHKAIILRVNASKDEIEYSYVEGKCEKNKTHEYYRELYKRYTKRDGSKGEYNYEWEKVKKPTWYSNFDLTYYICTNNPRKSL